MQKKIFIGLVVFFLSTQVFAKATFKNCNYSDQRTIQSLHTDMLEELKDLNQRSQGVPLYNLSYIKREYIYPESRIPTKKFPDPNSTYRKFHSKVTQVLSLMNKTARKGYKYTCHNQRQKRCRNGVYAYVLFLFNMPYGGVNLCPLFFELSRDDMADTLMHELSHLAAKTDHYMGTIFTPEGMIQSANDAYLYGRMKADRLERFFKFNSWGHMWRVPR